MIEPIKFDRETKLLLVTALKRGYFLDADISVLTDKKLLRQINFEVSNEETKEMLE